MNTKAFALIAFAGLLPLGQAQAAPRGAVYTPAPGSAERREMMDALRGPFGARYGARPVFQVFRLRAGGGYAYLDASALGPSGKPVAQLGEMGGSVSAFYIKRGGHWRVLRWGSYGGTDLIDECRAKYPRAPRALFAAG